MDTVLGRRSESSMDSNPIGIATSKQACSGSRADGLGGMKVGKANSVVCDRIDIGCVVSFLSVAPQITITEIIGKDHDDVGAIFEAPARVPGDH